MSRFFIASCVFLGLAVPIFVLASTTSGTINSAYKYAWSDQCGWVNFGCDNCDVSITDSAITGYAWSDIFGWINLSPTNGGVLNDSEGNLSGYAWGENMGWVDFSGVTINSSGQFTGTATGDIIGTLNFDCSNCHVSTDWRPASSRTTSNQAGGNSYIPTLPGPTAPTGGFKIKINDGSRYSAKAKIILTLDGGGEAQKMQISNYPDFHDASEMDYQTTASWALLQGDGPKTIYARFLADSGGFSEVVHASVILKTSVPDIAIASLKASYNQDEEVIFSGITEGSLDVIFSWPGHYSQTRSDSRGNWIANLGKLAPGDYKIIIFVQDSLGHAKTKVITARVIFSEAGEKESSIIEKISDIIKSIIRPAEPVSSPTITILEQAPQVLSGRWNLLPVKIK